MRVGVRLFVGTALIVAVLATGLVWIRITRTSRAAVSDFLAWEATYSMLNHAADQLKPHQTDNATRTGGGEKLSDLIVAAKSAMSTFPGRSRTARIPLMQSDTDSPSARAEATPLIWTARKCPTHILGPDDRANGNCMVLFSNGRVEFVPIGDLPRGVVCDLR